MPITTKNKGNQFRPLVRMTIIESSHGALQPLIESNKTRSSSSRNSIIDTKDNYKIQFANFKFQITIDKGKMQKDKFQIPMFPFHISNFPPNPQYPIPNSYFLFSNTHFPNSLIPNFPFPFHISHLIFPI